MNIHLPFLEGAAHAIADALRIHDSLTSQTKTVDPYLLSRAVDAIHLGADRMLKHAVAAIDPYLLLASPKAPLLKELRRSLLHGGSASIFTSPVHFETLGTSEIAKILVEVTHPTLDSGDITAFTEALHKIIKLRNHVQHGELYGDRDLILSDVKQLLGALYPIALSISPEMIGRLSSIDGQAESRLKAYKQEIDGAWQVLLDHLKLEREIRCPYKMYVALEGPDDSLNVTVSSGAGGNSIRTEFEVPPEDASGLFRLFYDAERQASRHFRRAFITALTEQRIEEVDNARDTQSSRPSAQSLASILGSYSSQRERHVPALDSGEFRVAAASASLWLHFKNMKGRASLRVNAILRDWRFEIENSENSGLVTGSLWSALGSHTARAGVIQVRGGLVLRGEHVLTEQDDVLELAPGTVWRTFSGELILTS